MTAPAPIKQALKKAATSTATWPPAKVQSLQLTLADAFVEGNVPFTFVDHPKFRQFLAEGMPGFPVPGRTTLTRLADTVYASLRQTAQQMIASAGAVSITTDAATTISGVQDPHRRHVRTHCSLSALVQVTRLKR